VSFLACPLLYHPGPSPFAMNQISQLDLYKQIIMFHHQPSFILIISSSPHLSYRQQASGEAGLFPLQTRLRLAS